MSRGVLRGLLAVLGVLAYASAQTLEPQSPAAWRFAVGEGARYAPLLYTFEDGQLVCAAASEREVVREIEARAAAEGLHPAYLAEVLAAYLWDDWSRFKVGGFDLREVVEAQPERLAGYLERAYLEHRACALGVMEVLVDGYEGRYALGADGRYRRGAKGEGEPYALLAFNPAFFPGTGLFEPLGVVYAVRLAELMQLGALRKPLLAITAQTLRKRLAESGDPLKVGR